MEAALKAGEAILKVYASAITVEYKSDRSPLTEADKNAHAVIYSFLEKTALPVLSEEGKEIPFEVRKQWEKFWMVDPLDGTKEFIRRNGEFTVNIALIENSAPELGVVYVPVQDLLFAAEVSTQKFYRLENAKLNWVPFSKNPEQFRHTGKMNGTNSFRIVASRSHQSTETLQFIEAMKREYPQVELVSAGSSLKICMLADGRADIYPRFAPTMEWDTAAGHALLKAVGKNLMAYPSNHELQYNKPDLLNDWFIAK